MTVHKIYSQIPLLLARTKPKPENIPSWRPWQVGSHGPCRTKENVKNNKSNESQIETAKFKLEKRKIGNERVTSQ